MSLVIIVFSILAGVHLCFVKKDWMNPGSIFLFYWAFVVYMASLRLYGLRETSDKAYSFVLIGVVFYYLGAYLASCRRNIKRRTVRKTIYLVQAR